MKAIRVEQQGGPEELKLLNIAPGGAPGPGQAVVRVVAAGVMERIAKSTHTVRIGILHHLAFQDFPVSIAELRRQWPSLHLTLDLGTTEELLEGLENNRFDIVVASSGYTSMADYRMSSNVSEDHLRKETLRWVQSERSQLDPKADPLPLVTFGPLCRFRPIAFDVLQKASRTWEVVYSGSSLTTIQSALQADLGYAVLPTYSIPGLSPEADARIPA
jgi:DNA-binding transcriptional LysR family regulator